MLAVEAAEDPAASQALDRGRALLFAEAGPDRDGGPGLPAGRAGPSRTRGRSARRRGCCRRRTWRWCRYPASTPRSRLTPRLTAGLHVLLFSDNVPVADEVALKRRASGLGRLVMGPGAGTAMLGGVGLGFANAVGTGPVGVVAAAGTGAQEVMTLLDRWGIGVSQVIGVGGRDLSAEVGGLMARDAVRALDADPGHRGHPAGLQATGRGRGPDGDRREPGHPGGRGLPRHVGAGRQAGGRLAGRHARGRRAAGRGDSRPARPDLSGSPGPDAEAAIARVGAGRTAVRGFFTGGTLCYEAQVILCQALGPVYSNIPLRSGLGLSELACPRRLGRTCAWTSARRSTPRAGRTR